MKHLNTKLAVTILGSLLGTSLLTGALVIQNQKSELERGRDRDGQSLAMTIAAMSVESMLAEPVDTEIVKSQIRTAALANTQVLYVTVHDDKDRLTAAFPSEPPSSAVLSKSSIFVSPIVVSVDDLPVEIRGRVEVVLDNDRFRQLTRSSILRLGAGTLCTFTILAFLLWFFLRRNVLGPVAILDRHVARLAQGDLSKSIVLDRMDELGRLASALDAMRLNLKESYARIEAQVTALQELDRMKDEFLANTSHELKTPLNGIIGLGESLLMGSYGALQADQEEAVQLIGSCADRLWKMTESILKFSRVHREDLGEECHPEPHDISEHLEESLSDLRATAEQAGLRIFLAVPHGLTVTYPRNELEQIVRILVDNAVKYTESGIIQVLVKKWRGTAGFQIAVRDTGCGIPPELHKKIFDPFVQGSSHETRGKGGVGLGLSIASKLIERLGGEIVLESEPGKGSTFTVLVPELAMNTPLLAAFEPWPPLEAFRGVLPEPISTEEISTEPPGAKADRDHVLIVDDENVNREVVYQALRDDFRVTRVADGHRALQVLRTQEVDLVLLDIMMPGMSGYQVLEKMAAEKLLEKARVVILSAKSTREAIVKGLELGASDYLGKPFYRAELLCRIRIQLQLKRQMKQLQAEVRKKSQALQVAEHASRVKTQFLGNMSHEIRTPLNGIIGFLELALEVAQNPEEREYLEIIRERAQFLLGIVSDILDMARIEAQETRVEYEECGIGETVRSVAAAWSGEAQKKGLTFATSVEPAIDRRAWIDRKKLGQILHHVIGNAVKFTGGGQVRVVARGAPSSDGLLRVEIRVEDTGIGIPAGKLEAIFQPFSQVDESSTRHFGGTGLGLSLSRSLARMLGGDIVVESGLGRGSVFTILVQALLEQPVATEHPAPLEHARA